MDVYAAVEYLEWTMAKSPKSYALHRDMLIDLRKALVNEELKYTEALNDNRTIKA